MSTSARYVQPLPFGAELLAPDRTRFRLWAPDCETVALQIEGRMPLPMQRLAGGLFELEVDCGAGTAYRYRVAQDLAVPDPASRAQRGDVHGPSLVVDPLAFEWQQSVWRGRPWSQTVFYELHVGLCGGFAQARALLPRLAELGVTAIELMPVAEFGGDRNWGYDGVLPYAPEASYGAPEELKALVDDAHGRGLTVYLDVVYNHFGPDGNFLPRYAKPFFRTDSETPWGAAIDFRQPAVRDFFIANALYWLNEYRFDGLRIDAVHAIRDPEFLAELSARVRDGIDAGRRAHLVLENERNQARLLDSAYTAQWNDDGHNVLHHLLTGEHEGYYGAYVDAPAEKLRRCLVEGFAYQGEAPPGQDTPRGESSAELPPTSFVLFLQNHDQVGNRAFGERLITLAGEEALRAATLLLLLSPQIPLLFMGEELGVRTPFLFFTGFESPDLAKAVRQGRRREFAKFPAFAEPRSRRAIPDPNQPKTFAASRPALDGPHDEAQQRWRDYYRALLALRAKELFARLDGARAAGAVVLGEKAVRAQWRLGDGAQLTIALNLDARDVAIEALPGRLLAQTAEGVVDQVAAGKLPPTSAIAVIQDA